MSDSKLPGRQEGAFSELVTIVDRLLGPKGCPWDREQSLETLRPYLIEETHEVLEAIEAGGPAEHCDELGDLLFQIVFQAALRKSEGSFDVEDVARSICDKLVRRHPHVFGEGDAADAAEVLAQWEEIKAGERAAKGEAPRRTLAGIPAGMPALARAQKISGRVARVGFDWPDVAGCVAKVREETGEVEEAAAAGDLAAAEAEIGDLLFATVSLARKLGVDAEGALRGANRKFERRFAAVEDRLGDRGKRAEDSDLAEMDALWDEVKAAEGEANGH